MTAKRAKLVAPLPLRSKSGRFRKATKREIAERKRTVRKYPTKPTHKSGAKQSDISLRSSPKRATPKRTSKPLSITLNGVKIQSGIKSRTTIAQLVAFTKVPSSRAVVRLNGERVYDAVSLHTGDEVLVRRLVKHQKIKVNRKRPEPREETPGFITESGDGEPVTWVNAFPEEWLHQDGTVAVEQSFIRCNPDAPRIYDRMVQLDEQYGIDSAQFRAYAESMAEILERPIQEVYTLFISP